MSDLIGQARALMRPPLTLVDGERDRIAPATDVAAEQVQAAKAALARDTAGSPRWAWRELDQLNGPMLPGDMLVVGAVRGNGKSALLMSQLDAFAESRMPTLYLPLEIDPDQCRRRWAAWKLNLDVRAVIRGEWESVGGAQARQAVEHVLTEQEQRFPHINFAPPKRITLAKLVDWCRWAQREYDARVVMIDHLHRMDFGADSANRRVTVTDVVRRLKDLARELGLVLICAAQLNRSSDPLDAFVPPLLSRLKESAAIEEEADVALMLSRRLRRDIPGDWKDQLRMGRITERDIADHGTMVVTCRKHRLDDDAYNGKVLLRVVNGRVEGRM